MSQPAAAMHQAPLRRTPLFNLHNAMGAKIVPFAGYEMPVQYSGILAEHLHTRASAGLFDVSHMGQIFITGQNALEKIQGVLSCDIAGAPVGGIKYNYILTPEGGVLDDLMISRLSQDDVFVVVNASRKDHDLTWLRQHLPDLTMTMRDDLSLVALQGPKAAKAFARFCDAPEKLKFMQIGRFEIKNVGPVIVSRSGYTGEDGFEISVPNDKAEALCRWLLNEPEVKPVGLGARDTLRLEAGLCLYGHELDETINPIEAEILWAIPKARRESGGFVGADAIKAAIATGVERKRVGIRPDGKAPARDGTSVLDAAGNKIGVISSGGYGPSVNGPIAMGYVNKSAAAPGTTVFLEVRGQRLPATVVALPFSPHRYFR